MIERDVSELPTHGFGAKNPLWWGNLGFMVIEGLGAAFAVATYLYLRAQNNYWPLGAQPSLTLPTIVGAWLLLSEIPNVWLKKRARARDLRAVRRGLIVMCAFGLVAILLRSFDLYTLNIRWDDNAYGSIIWFLSALQFSHVIVDVTESLVLTTCVHIGPVDERRFSDVVDNQDYWHFIVSFYLVIYVVIYWIPRLFEAKT